MSNIESEDFNDFSEPITNPQVKIDWDLYKELKRLGIIHDHLGNDDPRTFNVGGSDYSHHLIQPWTIWQAYNLNAWDADIIKRVLRDKTGESREMDYRKIIHICEERLRQLREERENNES